jgi:hypothetical protein
MNAPASDRTGPQPVLIPAGTRITCENGHRVCTTAVDLHVNEVVVVEMFTAWQIAAPQPGDMFPRCGICGGAAHRENRDGVTLHTPDGWR